MTQASFFYPKAVFNAHLIVASDCTVSLALALRATMQIWEKLGAQK
jgi:hypothetical protein